MGGERVIDRIRGPSWLVRALRWFGRRGLVLLLVGTAWMMLGYIYATDDTERFSRSGPGGLLQFLDDNPWPGLFWMICGAITVITGCVRRRFDGDDAIGFATMVLPCLLWTLAYLTSAVLFTYTTYTRSEPILGQERAASGLVVYLMIILFLFLVARWPDPIDAEENVRRSNRKTRKDAQVRETKRIPGPPWASHEPYDPSGP